jgi:Ca-activated chloride channel homolog
MYAQKPENLIAKGNEAYKKKDYKTAANDYLKALQKDNKNEAARFNMANAYQQQDSYQDAAKLYDDLLSTTKDPGLQSKTFYNSGLSMVKQKQLEQAIERFKGSLRINPTDTEARENLQKAINELKKQQQKEDQNKQDKKKDEKQDEKKDKKQEPNKLNQNKAEQLLKQLQEQEKQLQKQVQKQKSNPQQQEKDW